MISTKKLAAQTSFWHGTGNLLATLCLLLGLFVASLPAHAKNAARSDVLDNCSWNRPGADPFMGDVVAAVDRYTDIAPQVREQLKQRMRTRQYDEIVVISRDAIRGKQNYHARISDMHFGPGRVCRNVTRAGWSDQMQERGLVYCVQGQCILVPTVCRNVSRITQATAATPPAAGGAVPAGATPVAAVPAVPAAPAEGVPVVDNPDALRGGSATGGTMPSSSTEPSFIPYFPVHLASSMSSGGGGGGGSGGGRLPDDSTSFIEPHPYQPPVILPSLPTEPSVLPAVPEPQTWAMLAAGLLLMAWTAWRRRQTQLKECR